MSALTLEQKADACKLLYRALGFARMGAVPTPDVAQAMGARTSLLQAAGVLAADACATVSRVIGELRAGRMADEGLCKQAMDQVNQVRLPLLAECREEAQRQQQTDRPRERG